MPALHALHPELHQPTKRSRTVDVVRAAVNDGRPLPLSVMLENMWRYRDEAQRLEAVGSPEHDPMAARACRMAAQKCAVDAAPFVHPKLANVAVRPEDEEEAQDRRAAARVTADSLRGRSVTELGRMFLQIAKGEDVGDSSPLAPHVNRDVGAPSLPPDDRATDDATTPNETPPEGPA